MKVLLLAIFAVCLIYGNGYSQGDAQAIIDLIQAAEQLRSVDPEQSKKNYEKALALAMPVAVYSDYAGKICLALGTYYLRNNQLDSASYRLQQALDLFSTDNVLIGEVYISQGSIAYYRNQLPQAMEKFITALKVFERDNDNMGRSRALNNLGAISEAQNDFKEAFNYYKQSFELKKIQKDSSGMARSLNNMGSASIAMKEYRQAVDYLLASVAIKQQLREYRGLASSYANLGIAYKELGDYKKAIEYHKKNLSEDRRSGQTNDLFYGYNNLANVYHLQGNLNEAQRVADSALYFAANAANIKNLMEAYNTLYQISEKKNDAARALVYFKSFIHHRDSLLSVEKNRDIENLRIAYETEKKEQTIRELEQANLIKDLQANTDRQLRIFLIALALLLMVLIFVFYNRYRLKQRTSLMLNEKNQELITLNGFKDRVFSVISHDLKSPLSSFRMLTQNLSANFNHISNDELSGYLAELDQSSQRVYNTMNNLLEWAITQTGRMPFRCNWFDAHECGRQIIEQLTTVAHLKKIKVRNQIKEDCLIYGDKRMLEIVLRNLLSNAIKFSNEGSEVSLSAEADGNEIKINVTDNGVGMTADEVRSLFRQDIDVQTIGKSVHKGTGIGLLLCKELIDRHGGKIWAESKPGSGSVFSFTIPHGTR